MTTSTSAISPISGHIICVGAAGWGHQKPLAPLACRIIQQRSDILVTILVFSRHGIEKRLNNEAEKYLRKGDLRSNIRIINIGEKEGYPLDVLNALERAFGSFYKKLAHSEPILCTTGKLYEPVAKPTLAIVDYFLPGCVQAIRDISGNDVSILGWNTANAAFGLRILGPEKLGGYGDIAQKAVEAAAATGRSASEVESELLRPNTGEVIPIPGLPPMFDYELTSHVGNTEVIQIGLIKRSYKFMQICDGMIFTSSIVYEMEALAAWRDWLSETNRKFYVIGPFLPHKAEQGAFAEATETTKSNDPPALQKDLEIISFLDKNLEEKGRNSVLYVSFGSSFWPNPDHVWMLIDILIELKYPFIMAHASPQAVIPPDVSLKVQESATGILSSWAPQQLILDHPATGWFLTHCGHNSVMEALGQGMPLMAWPLEADQPANAARLSLLNLGFELFETRRGRGLKPLYRGIEPTGTPEAIQNEMRKILQDAKGTIGERKRQNVHRMRDAIQGTWDEHNGAAMTQLRKLLTDYFPG